MLIAKSLLRDLCSALGPYVQTVLELSGRFSQIWYLYVQCMQGKSVNCVSGVCGVNNSRWAVFACTMHFVVIAEHLSAIHEAINLASRSARVCIALDPRGWQWLM